MKSDRHRLYRNELKQRLLSMMNGHGVWEGELSSSALSTATALFALSLADTIRYSGEIKRGLNWLAAHQNEDGGWGDTLRSQSNVSTTSLVWAAFTCDRENEFNVVVEKCEKWLSACAGSVRAQDLAPTIEARYGRDKTFSVPILTMVTLSGRWGHEGWNWVKNLPFELAALPPSFYSKIKLPVVSYAMPALIAMGQARFFHAPRCNIVSRFLRKCTVKKTLKILSDIQPSNGGYLEATPLTSFVCMCLLSMNLKDHDVTVKALNFIKESVREDGSWPIDTNLSTWVTTLSVNALSESRESLANDLGEQERAQLSQWLLDQQFKEIHPYTRAAPGGWAWTNLPGAVPDADDTAGALIALHNLNANTAQQHDAIRCGLIWLCQIQNRDGGIPTFCRGWGHLPFDRSGPDLTAHALRAFSALVNSVPDDLKQTVDKSVKKALRYLKNNQFAAGYWLPLWFGSQYAEDDENRIYGTVKVLQALRLYRQHEDVDEMIYKAHQWLLKQQNEEGSFGHSVEETALALSVISRDEDAVKEKTFEWLYQHRNDPPAPIGFYFAKLWYFEKMYPLVYQLEACQNL